MLPSFVTRRPWEPMDLDPGSQSSCLQPSLRGPPQERMPNRTVRGDEHMLCSGRNSSFEFSQNIAKEGACVAPANGMRAHIDDDKTDASGQSSDSFAPR